MMTPVQAILWQTWQSWRWGFVLGTAYLIMAAGLAHWLPGVLSRTLTREAFLPNLGTQLALPSAFMMIHLAAVFSLTGADLKERGYWRVMFALPVRTRTLVAWPMIWGSLALGCIWLFVAIFILRPTGQAVPLVWPLVALAVGLSLMQAVSWMPVEQQWLSIVIAVLAAFLFALVVTLVIVFQVSEPLAVAIFLSLLPLTYAACLRGVAAARRGDIFDWQLWNRLMAWAAARKKAGRPFASAARAQLWFECRCFAWLMPLAIVMVFPFLVALVVLEARNQAAAGKPLAIVLFMPALFATVVGVQLGSASFPFVATRPVSSVALVRSKFSMALVSTLLAYIPVLLILPIPFFWPNFSDSLLQAARAVGAPKAATILVLVVVLSLLMTWKGIAEGLWMGLIGRPWLQNAFAFGFATLVGGGTLFAVWVAFYPAVQALVLSLVPWLVGCLLALKSIIAVWVVAALVRSRLASGVRVGLMIAGWGLIVTAICLLIVWLVPGSRLPVRDLIAGVVLLVPFSRLAGAPLALDWNRHR
jgi:hypothetical protein